ncbi:MAG: hypothetical protein B7Y15_07095 [Bacteroidetes bacterium 24-39-8]|nr:MAG: hypothetical protein B7Y69_11170 [Sphingobacteriia bacterium 35-40-8]OYZ51111.1 MAG: hypothetical protein B7Y15_07095 [Bacteroidetes bacterium 24-39-8]OZA62092.1 MAG: hypothetical protein B7X72_12825 [Sphingobacteriia bacterium 39-39-8]
MLKSFGKREDKEPIQCILVWLVKNGIFVIMRPDYPHKVFGDIRISYCLLMVALAMDTLF